MQECAVFRSLSRMCCYVATLHAQNIGSFPRPAKELTSLAIVSKCFNWSIERRILP